MHIPDSAISPATSLAAGAAMAPVWYAAGRRLNRDLSRSQVPLLAVGSAFCFTVMLFNIPAPGGTTVHPVGAVLLAVLLGPWAAVIGVTVALVIQALFFGDGGVLALGANSFSMALAMPMCGYVAYRLTAGRSSATDPRRGIAAGIGAYVGVNIAALVTAIVLGIQPALYHDAQGHALYFVWGLKVTVPAMLLPHLTVAGVAEAVVTCLAVRYLQTAGLPLYGASTGTDKRGRLEMAWVGLAALLGLAPLGMLATGEAWGEWSSQEVARRAGYAPARLASVEAHGWRGFHLLPDYLADRGPVFYVLAGAVGALMAIGVLLLAGRALARRKEAPVAPGAAGTGDPTGEARPGIPAWMLSGAEPGGAEVLQVPAGRGRGSTAYLGKALEEMAVTARQTVFADSWAREDGALQGVDPRVKVVGALLMVVLVSIAHRLPVLLGLYALALALGAASRLPLTALARRAWLSVGLFVGALTLPAALNLVTPGPSLLVLWREPYLAITAPGLGLACVLALRTATAVSFVLLLTLTTRWDELLAGLRALLVPRPFILVLTMTYRYLAVLLQAATEMLMARRSRDVGRADRSTERRFLAGAMGSLFGRTLGLTDAVTAAMMARGWTGEPRTLRRPEVRWSDALWLAGICLIAVVTIALETAHL